MFRYVRFFLTGIFVLLCGCETTQKEVASSLPASILPYYQTPISTPIYDNLLAEDKHTSVTRVGMLLPLSGKSASVGEELRNAGMLAQFDSASENFVLQFYDTQGTADGAKDAFHQAVRENVQVILGPVFAHEVQAIRKAARHKGIPVISFTSDTDVVESGVYTLALSLSEQTERAVRHACETGKMRLAILAPDNKAGDIAIEVAEKTAEACGMEVTKKSVYNPKYINFEPYVLSVLPENFADRKEDKTPKEETENSDLTEPELPVEEQLDFDALFIADSGNRLKAIASLFALYDVNPDIVMFLGMYSWEDKSTSTESALKNGVYSSLPSDKFDNWFVPKYEEVYGKKPMRLASLAYDAVALSSALSQRGGVTRESLTDSFGFEGIDGLFRLNINGYAERLMGISKIVGKNQFKVIRAPSVSFGQEAQRKENLSVIKEANEIYRARQAELSAQEETKAETPEPEAKSAD